jgi:vanillate O-demethylase ferredoxin subunit
MSETLQQGQTLLVVSKTREAEDIFSFELIDPEGRELPPFTAGAHIDVQVAPGLVRQYSLCNSPRERRRYLIGVLREPASRGGSLGMHETIKVGDRLQVSAPRNLFELSHDAERHLLFAGGIGVTPILSMAERLHFLGAPFEMHYKVRSRRRGAFLARSAELGARHYFDDEPDSAALELDRVLASPAARTHLYVCGPAGFIRAVTETALRCGWPEEQIHKEVFVAAAPVTASESFDIKIASTGQILTVPAERSVLEVLAVAGIEVPSMCGQGLCGTCITGVLEGSPDHRDSLLTAAERAKNDRFTPCCSRSLGPLLVLDL